MTRRMFFAATVGALVSVPLLRSYVGSVRAAQVPIRAYVASGMAGEFSRVGSWSGPTLSFSLDHVDHIGDADRYGLGPDYFIDT